MKSEIEKFVAYVCKTHLEAMVGIFRAAFGITQVGEVDFIEKFTLK